jgi:ABC-type phosphate transport system permease subunit
LFESGQTIASKIAGSIAETGTPEELGSLAALGLALFLITLGLSLAVRYITRRSVVGASS